jgi:hypothetical protein
MPKLIGTAPNQVPVNGFLGNMAFQNKEGVVVDLLSTTTLSVTGAASFTGSIAASLGAVGTPSYTFTGDLNTGMWSPAADTIAFSEGGVEAMRIDSSANVGIGTSAAAARLHVVNSVIGNQFRIQDNTTDATAKYGTATFGHYTNAQAGILGLGVGALSASNTIYVGGGFGTLNAATAIQFFTAANNTTLTGTERMRIDGTGQVGIGVTPMATGANGNLLQIGNPTTSAGSGLTIGSTTTADIQFSDATTGTGQYAGLIRYSHTSDFMGLWTASTERMRIDASGNLGVGTSSPDALLDVERLSASGTGPAARFYRNQQTIENLIGFSIYNNVSGGLVDTTLVYGNTVNSYLAIGQHNGTSYAERMRIDAAGNVGIGVAPSAWGSTYRALQIKNDNTNNSGAIHSDNNSLNIGLGNNFYRNDVGSYYINTANATDYLQFNGRHEWSTAPSGTAGNAISFTKVMALDASGNLGVGTASPRAVTNFTNIGINGTSGSFIDFFTGGTRYGTISSTSAELNISTPTALPFTFSTNATERMRIDSSGNVGISNTTPRALLHVGTSASLTDIPVPAGNFAIVRAGSYGSASTGGIQLSGGYGDAGRVAAWQIKSVGSGSAGTFANDLLFTTQNSFSGSETERMRIDASGNVGIGTSGPGYRLDVVAGDTTAGLGYAMRLRSNATATAAAMQFTNSTVSAQNGLISCTDAGVFTLQGDSATAALAFRTNGDERFRINASGGITSSALADAVGYKGLPQNSQTAAYTLALADMGKMINTTTGGVVIPANGTVAFPIGSAISIYNNSASNQTISITTDTLYLAGTATTGSRTLAQRGLATCVKVTATTWVISGAGVT